MRALYSALLYLLIPLALLRLLWRGLRAPAYLRRWGERFGFVPVLEARPWIWVHAVSVGEVQAAAPLVTALLERYPEYELLVTTTTPTGAMQGQRLFGQRVRHCYLPWDLPDAVARFLGRVQPRLGLIMETELWPNLIAACQRRNIPVALINARLSARSAARYRRVPGLTAATLGRVSWIGAQTRADAERLIDLGAAPARVTVTGNTKFDAVIPGSAREQAEVLRRGWDPARPVWIAASTHEGEDELLLAAHRRVRARLPQALLILVPRHPERFARVAGLVERAGFRGARRSRNEAVTSEAAVYLGDTMGELPVLLAAADLAFVGGSLVPVGGHNPLEPAALGLPILCGPHMFNFSGIVQLLEAAGAVRTVADVAELAAAVTAWLEDASERAQWGERARQAVEANRGARDRVLQHLAALL
ncbi:lipid IV(A) 3-deoxy-D-manno-octulosonic acid transferase [Thiohalobacter thiocyanaticus]|uniref:3-deoxy-D-manno-octulosonic acid transferase n=1 Tax=Thiohalobacter thiocyanaticus TaxID=585455 RepID=A0A426QIM5_9GAMM|nr:lipid IV(A) 3-deoxy-D-manno-octulosonic acid transferase [Thiohalobacter thiocyanaticus]RRQ21609.1 3-deoxy-D-manno-octulosonic acid transferase [Thiohalobacter thiocyanaticus]